MSEPDARCIRRRRVAYAVLCIQLDLLLLGRPTIVGGLIFHRRTFRQTAARRPVKSMSLDGAYLWH